MKSEAEGRQPIDVYLVSKVEDTGADDTAGGDVVVDDGYAAAIKTTTMADGTIQEDVPYDYYLAMLNSEAVAEFYAD